jgi:hypothetical protein
MAEVFRNGYIHYRCDKCGEGEMETIAVIDKGGKNVYWSVCNKTSCGYQHNMLRQYPEKIELVKVI